MKMSHMEQVFRINLRISAGRQYVEREFAWRYFSEQFLFKN